jgi:hypothetical protein
MTALTHATNNWIEKLRTGNKIWLVKENIEAEIGFPYEPP